MSIQYQMVRKRDYINPEGEKKTGYYPQVVRGRTVDLRELSERVAKGSTLKAFEVQMALHMALEHIEKELLDSNHVCLNGFGTFSLTAESRRADSPDTLRAESVKVKRVVFIASKTLMGRIKNARFLKAVR